MLINVILCFIKQCVSDNIEIAKKDFDLITFNNVALDIVFPENCNYLKISHLGTSIYSIVNTGKKKWKIVDKSVYLKSFKSSPLRLDFEKKKYGIPIFVYKFILYNIVIVLTSLKIINICFKYEKTIIRYFNKY